MNDCLSNWRCSFWEHQQRCGGAGGGALLSRVFAQIKGSEKEMNHSEVIANDRYSSTLGECGDCCVFEMQKWQFNYLCLTWRWKGSESLWEHVYIYSGFFFSFKWSYESRECSLFWQAQHFLNLRTPHMDPQLKSNMIILCVHNTICFTEFKWCCFYQSAFKV